MEKILNPNCVVRTNEEVSELTLEEQQKVFDSLERYGLERFLTRIERSSVRSTPELMAKIEKVLWFLGRQVVQDFCIDDANRTAYTQLSQWLIGDLAFDGDLAKGLYISGTIGSGKSVLVNLFAGLSAVFDFTYRLSGRNNLERKLIWRVYKPDEIVKIYTQKGHLGDLSNIGVLCIDDIGSETYVTSHYGCRSNPISDLLEYRCERPYLYTILTSNYPLSSRELLEAYGKRVVSRVVGSVTNIKLLGEDRRTVHTPPTLSKNQTNSTSNKQ